MHRLTLPALAAKALLRHLALEFRAERPSLSSHRGLLGRPRQDTLSLSADCPAPGGHSNGLLELPLRWLTVQARAHLEIRPAFPAQSRSGPIRGSLSLVAGVHSSSEPVGGVLLETTPFKRSRSETDRRHKRIVCKRSGSSIVHPGEQLQPRG